MSRSPAHTDADRTSAGHAQAPPAPATKASRLAYDRAGSGEPLILLHGQGFSRRCWDPVIAGLAARPRRDHSRPPRPRRLTPTTRPPRKHPPRPGHRRRRTPRRAEHPRPRTWRATASAAGSPWNWAGCTAREPSPPCPRPGCGDGGLRATSGWPCARFGSPPKSPASSPRNAPRTRLARGLSMIQASGHPFRLPYEPVRTAVHDMAAAPGFRETLRGLEQHRFEDGAAITVPVTIAFGSRDRVLLPGVARRRDQLPDHTRWITLTGCGHVPMFDDPHGRHRPPARLHQPRHRRRTR